MHELSLQPLCSSLPNLTNLRHFFGCGYLHPSPRRPCLHIPVFVVLAHFLCFQTPHLPSVLGICFGSFLLWRTLASLSPDATSWADAQSSAPSPEIASSIYVSGIWEALGADGDSRLLLCVDSVSCESVGFSAFSALSPSMIKSIFPRTSVIFSHAFVLTHVLQAYVALVIANLTRDVPGSSLHVR